MYIHVEQISLPLSCLPTVTQTALNGVRTLRKRLLL